MATPERSPKATAAPGRKAAVRKGSTSNRSGSAGWDAYAPFYDWENTRTFGRRDLAFWRTLVDRERGEVLELGCGTGRLLIPLARGRAPMTGLDRSETMLRRARVRGAALPRKRRPKLAQGDVTALPFGGGAFSVVLAPYGLLQSLLTDRALDRTLGEAARVLRRGGLLGIDLVPDLRAWKEYDSRVRLEGRRPGGAKVTLVESVRQDRRRGLTIFDEEFIETTRGRPRRRRFTLTFRTRPVAWMVERLRRAGFHQCARFGDYQGGPLTAKSDAWLILARKK